jgi:hypothetical protein
MLTSISPFGERARGQRWGSTITAYVFASALGGAVVGALLGGAGAAGGRAFGHDKLALGVLAVVALAGLVADAGVAGMRVPGPARQVDENWLGAYRGWVYGAGFGFQLGAAFTTIVTASITYVAFACAFLAGSVAGGVAIGATFGAIRALPLLLTARVDGPTELRAVMRRFNAALPRARAGAYALQAAAAVTAIVGAFVVGGS